MADPVGGVVTIESADAELALLAEAVEDLVAKWRIDLVLELTDLVLDPAVTVKLASHVDAAGVRTRGLTSKSAYLIGQHRCVCS